jgi:hypothetical protein
MNLNSKTCRLSAAGLGALLLGVPTISAQSQETSIESDRDGRRLDGARLTAMRAFAQRLDEAAWKAARDAGDIAREPGALNRQRFLQAINDFARQTRSLHARLDESPRSPSDVADEVAVLDQRARQISVEIRTAKASPETQQNWTEAVKALDLMTRSLRGQIASLPPAADRGEAGSSLPDNQDNGNQNTRDILLTGSPLMEFRRLAHTLNQEIDRSLAIAQERPGTSQAAQRVVADLRRFRVGVASLEQSSASQALSPRAMRPMVSRLMEEARLNGRRVNESPALPWLRLDACIRLLEQMAAILQ